MSELKPFDEFMDALVHCDTVKVILTGCGESTFETKPIHEGICALANRRAERRERAAVLSCKVGDTVYYPYAGRVITKRITQYREILRKSEAIDRWYCLEFSNNETFDADDIGKTVFLTREEAEAELGGEER